MDYEKEYKKLKADISKAYLYAQTDSTKAVLESILPELKDKENEDEKIREILIHIVKGACGKYGIKYQGIETGEEKLLAWLEKKGGQKPTMIQWTGDNLKELVQFTGKSPKFEEWFKTWEDFENYVHTHNNIFKIFNKDGSHIEIPVGAWIVKTPDGYNVASRYVFKEKPADKVNPKFKVGDWVINTITKEVEQVIELAGCEYICSGHLIVSFNNQHLLRLWTINDAKDGDVLSNGKMIVIFKHFEEPSYRQHIVAYIGLDTSGNIQITDDTWNLGIDKTKPATKEQRDTLMKAMADAGYTFDFEKKELKELAHQETSEWSEDDSRKIETLLSIIFDYAFYKDALDENKDLTGEYAELSDWLQSIPERFNLQPKQEWNELLEKFRQAVYDCAWGKVTCKAEGETKEEYVNRWTEHFLLIVRNWADGYEVKKNSENKIKGK